MDMRQAERITTPFEIDQFVKYGSDYSNGDDEEEFIEAKGVNLSSGGLACESAASLEPLTRVFIMFRLPGNGRQISGEAYVTHSEREGGLCRFGLRFQDLGADDRAAIDAYVAAAGAR